MTLSELDARIARSFGLGHRQVEVELGALSEEECRAVEAHYQSRYHVGWCLLASGVVAILVPRAAPAPLEARRQALKTSYCDTCDALMWGTGTCLDCEAQQGAAEPAP